jgi:hypothetical protein
MLHHRPQQHQPRGYNLARWPRRLEKESHWQNGDAPLWHAAHAARGNPGEQVPVVGRLDIVLKGQRTDATGGGRHAQLAYP